MTPGNDQRCAETACGTNRNAPYCDKSPLTELPGCTGDKKDYVYSIGLEYDSNGAYCSGVKNYSNNVGSTLYITRANYYPTYRWKINSATSNNTLCENKNGYGTVLDLAKDIDNILGNTDLQDTLVTGDAYVSLYAEWATSPSMCNEDVHPSGCPLP